MLSLRQVVREICETYNDIADFLDAESTTSHATLGSAVDGSVSSDINCVSVTTDHAGYNDNLRAISFNCSPESCKR